MEDNTIKYIKYGVGVTALIGAGVFVYKFVKEYKRQNAAWKEALEYEAQERARLEEQHEEELDKLNGYHLEKERVLKAQIAIRDADVIVDSKGEVTFEENAELAEMRQRQTDTDNNGEELVVSNVFDDYGDKTVTSMIDYIMHLYSFAEDEDIHDIDDSTARWNFPRGVSDDRAYIKEALERLHIYDIETFLTNEEIRNIKQERNYHEKYVDEPISFSELILYYAYRYETDIEDGYRTVILSHMLVNGIGMLTPGLSAEEYVEMINNVLSGGAGALGYGLFGNAKRPTLREGDVSVTAQYSQFLTELFAREIERDE